MSILRDGSIGYLCKYKSRSGSTHRVMSPIEFMCRLAALVPPPRIPQLRYHGCLAPASPLRRLVVPTSAPDDDCEHDPQPTPPAPARPRPPDTVERGPDTPPRKARTSAYIPWATLLARTFGVDALQCPRCPKGRLRPVAVITREHIISRILTHLRLPTSPAVLDDGCTQVWDVTDQSLPAWVAGSDPEPPDAEARAPPGGDYDCIDPPCPDD